MYVQYKIDLIIVFNSIFLIALVMTILYKLELQNYIPVQDNHIFQLFSMSVYSLSLFWYI